VPGDNLTVLVYQNRVCKAEPADGIRHAGYLLVAVRPCIPRVWPYRLQITAFYAKVSHLLLQHLLVRRAAFPKQVLRKPFPLPACLFE
jgi:hypothetical protein